VHKRKREKQRETQKTVKMEIKKGIPVRACTTLPKTKKKKKRKQKNVAEIKGLISRRIGVSSEVAFHQPINGKVHEHQSYLHYSTAPHLYQG
jgi:ribosomal protein L31E